MMTELILLEANDLIAGKINLLDVGITKISKITIQLEQDEIKLQKDFDKALKQYIDVSERYPYHSGGIIDIVKEFPNRSASEIISIALQLGFPNLGSYLGEKLWTLIDRGILSHDDSWNLFCVHKEKEN